MKTPDCPQYSTTDLALAAFLVALGHPLLSVGRHEGYRRVFRFPQVASEVAATFYRNAHVPGRAFASALRDLKTLIRET